MKKWTSTKVGVEGHADYEYQRYNLALGERRAEAVRNYIVSLGVPVDRMTIVSKGEEQPFCSEETEACWQQKLRTLYRHCEVTGELLIDDCRLLIERSQPIDNQQSAIST
jgi:hypothetical protein